MKRSPFASVVLVSVAALLAACGPGQYTVGGQASDASPADTSATMDATQAPDVAPVDASMITLPDGNTVLPECVEGTSSPSDCTSTGLMCTANLRFCRFGRWSECRASVRAGCTEGVTDAGMPDVVAPDAGPPAPGNCAVMGRGTICVHGTECISGVCADGSNSLVRCTDGALSLTRACPVIIDAGPSDSSTPDVGVPDTGIVDAGSPDVIDVPDAITADASADALTDTAVADTFVPANCTSPFGVCLHHTECFSGVCADGTFTRGMCMNGVFTPTRMCTIPDAGPPDTGIADAAVDVPRDVPVDTGPTFAIDDSNGGIVFATVGLTGPIVITELVPFSGVTATQTTTERGVTFYEIAPLPFRIADGRFRFQVTINGQPLAGISGGSCVRTGIASWWQFDVFEKRTGYYMEWYPEMVDGVCAFTVARWPYTDYYWSINYFVSYAQYYLARLDAGTDAATDASADVAADVSADAMTDAGAETSVDVPVDASSDVRDAAVITDVPADVRDAATTDVSSSDSSPADVPPTVDTITVTGLTGWTTVTTFDVSVFGDSGGAASVVCTPNLTVNPPMATCTGTVTAPFRVSTHIMGTSLSGLPIPGITNIYDPGVWMGSTCTALTTVRTVLTGGRTVSCTTASNGRGGCDYLCR